MIYNEVVKYYNGLRVIDINKKFPLDLNNNEVPTMKIFEYLHNEFVQFEKDRSTKAYMISGFPRSASDALDFEKYVHRL